MSFGWLLPVLVAVALDVLVLYYLARGPAKRFLLVLVFCVIQILCTCSATIASVAIGVRTRTYVDMYWTGDMLAHTAISLLMLSLIWQTLEPGESRRTIIICLTLA